MLIVGNAPCSAPINSCNSHSYQSIQLVSKYGTVSIIQVVLLSTILKVDEVKDGREEKTSENR